MARVYVLSFFRIVFLIFNCVYRYVCVNAGDCRGVRYPGAEDSSSSELPDLVADVELCFPGRAVHTPTMLGLFSPIPHPCAP